MIIKEIPSQERPREKALRNGIENLSNSELLAILLRTGYKNENVLKLSEGLLYSLNSINNLNELTINELTKIKGIGITKAITIKAAVELGLRIIKAKDDLKSFKNALEVFLFMQPYIKGLKEEHLYGLYLNAKGLLIDMKLLTKGNLNSTIMDGKQIFKWGYKLSASAIILVHNHPSGDPTPSIQDLKYTELIIKQANITGFIILDHIIIGETYYSMKSNNQIFKLF